MVPLHGGLKACTGSCHVVVVSKVFNCKLKSCSGLCLYSNCVLIKYATKHVRVIGFAVDHLRRAINEMTDKSWVYLLH